MFVCFSFFDLISFQGKNTTMCLYGVWEGTTPTCTEVMMMRTIMIYDHYDYDDDYDDYDL